jgi:DNA-binding LytR/AlgR family response regulator
MKRYQQKGLISQLIINQKTSQKVFVDNVILLKGDSNYTTFYLKNGNSKLVAHSLKFFEPHLQEQGFLRVHRSYMVNPNYIKTYNENTETLTMENGYEANISRRRKNTLKRL